MKSIHFGKTASCLIFLVWAAAFVAGKHRRSDDLLGKDQGNGTHSGSDFRIFLTFDGPLGLYERRELGSLLATGKTDRAKVALAALLLLGTFLEKMQRVLVVFGTN